MLSKEDTLPGLRVRDATMTTAYINRIATATPPHDMHRPFAGFAESMLPEGMRRNLFRRMTRLCGIEHRHSFVRPVATEDGSWKDADGFYIRGNFPPTKRRMQAFEEFAPRLAKCALARLALTDEERRSITHVIASPPAPGCTRRALTSR